MVKKLLSLFSLCLFLSATAFAQTGTLTGQVTDQSSGEVLPGVNIYIVELERGSATDTQGEYTIDDIDYGTYTVRASFVGYDTFEQEVTIDQQSTTLDIALSSQTQQLDDVVVTAFGLNREERSLSYSIQEVSGEDLSATGEGDLIGSLAGKVSGVQIIGSPGAAIGGTQKIRIRGNSGLSPSNPLIVVDGTPISNQSFSPNSRDYGNLAQDLNLDDIQSVSVLKGAAAAAMYGNRASDGVVVIETKGGQIGERPFQVEYSNNTSLSEVYILPEYQNQYAGGYTQSLIDYTDPETGESVKGLNYAADESWGPPIEGQMYRPWWSWYHGDFNGDGQDDYGTQIPLEAHPDNIRNFFDTGINTSNSLAISGGSSNSAYRVSIEDAHTSGVMPNSSLDKMYLNFNGSLQHSDKLTSKVTFNYVNTQGKGRPTQGYSPLQGNPIQSFNQWFQRQLDMDYVENYKLDDGSLTSWNIRSPSNLRPLYWNSPYFSVMENVPTDDRDRVYGNYSLTYNINPNLKVAGKVHADMYDSQIQDRIASGGLETDWFRVSSYTRREMNYEGSIQYTRDFQDWSFDSYLGGNIRHENYGSVIEATVGGLSVPNLFNISASNDRPDVSNYTEIKKVRSAYGTANVGWRDMIYADLTLRNDWSSALPENNNSYLYYGLSGSFVFTELGVFDNLGFLTYGKLRASHAQVGSDLDPYEIQQTYSVQNPRGSNPALAVPDTKANPNLKAAITTDTEFGLDLRFLQGRLRLDGTYYQSVSEDEILNLQVSSASGYDQALINAGKFTKKGLEVQFGGTPIQSQDFNLDLTLNWATILSNKVNELAPQLETRLLERPTYFIGGSSLGLWAREGEEWGKIISPGYQRHENGQPIINPSTGSHIFEPSTDHGSIIPDWNGGFRANVSYKNFALSAFVDFQKGGKFYSITKMFNNYSGLGAATVGTNPLGNAMRDPVLDSQGNAVTAVKLENAASNSGGKLVEGVDSDGNPVSYLTDPGTYYFYEFYTNEGYIYDASYVKLRSVRLNYQLPSSLMERLPISQASVSVYANNPLLIYASTDGVDPSIIQDAGDGFGWWEGGTVPGTRSIGASVNLTF